MKPFKGPDAGPLVARPDLVGGVGHWEPSLAADHQVPLHHAQTEAGAVAAILALVLAGCMWVLEAPLVGWGIGVFVVVSVGLGTFIARYEQHVAYVRENRVPILPDLDINGEPDRMHGVWYGRGAPKPRPGTLEATYRDRFALFVHACRKSSDVRSLRAQGFDDGLQALFREWLIDHNAGAWISNRGHNPGWKLGDAAVVAQVLRCTNWERDST